MAIIKKIKDQIRSLISSPINSNPARKNGPKIKNGMVFCIEPMICHRDGTAKILEDKWAVVSADGLRGSHYEHTVAIIDGRAEILSKL